MRRQLAALLALTLAASAGCGKGDKAGGKDKGGDKAKTTAKAAPAGKGKTAAGGKDKGEGKAKAAASAPAGGGKAPAAAASSNPDPAAARPAAAPLPAVIAYADTESALAQLVRDLALAIEDRREADAARLIHTLKLPDHEKWFAERFPKKRATKLVADYDKQREDLGNLALAIRDARKRGLSEIKATRLAAPTDAHAVGYQVAALETLATGDKPTALYSVRLHSPDGSRTFHVWSFVHDAGSFRFVGKMKAAGSENRTPSGRDVNEFTRADAERILAVEKSGDTP